jgi:hypothetical protein
MRIGSLARVRQPSNPSLSRVHSFAQPKQCRATARAGPSDVFVLDFDGVLVDSEPEVRPAGVSLQQPLQLLLAHMQSLQTPDHSQAVP